MIVTKKEKKEKQEEQEEEEEQQQQQSLDFNEENVKLMHACTCITITCMYKLGIVLYN
jgi:hypothetical protein